ncbi:hypothetical protein C0989_011253 [Termitomyces sp. Mn162]|nr:hypothetical protein C0989_011253 [Termitomyces sp. Mn162]
MSPTSVLEENKVGAEGTFYQAQLRLKPTRNHFFAPVDLVHAEAVHRDAETVEYSDEEEVSLTPSRLGISSNSFHFQKRQVKRKIDTTILPLVICRREPIFYAMPLLTMT